ncbi:alpha-hydroxy-acid oxidizing protein [Bordetella genomosp. 2]|nr:alpha-hydroxy-acid oxidizing protein [Bordetella genomosp. 2]
MASRARRALAILRDELQRTMQLCGVCEVAGIGPDLLFREPPPQTVL